MNAELINLFEHLLNVLVVLEIMNLPPEKLEFKNYKVKSTFSLVVIAKGSYIMA